MHLGIYNVVHIFKVILQRNHFIAEHLKIFVKRIIVHHGHGGYITVFADVIQNLVQKFQLVRIEHISIEELVESLQSDFGFVVFLIEGS